MKNAINAIINRQKGKEVFFRLRKVDILAIKRNERNERKKDKKGFIA